MSDKITAEKLQAVYENSEQVKALNTELESILYGTDTGGKSYYDVFWDSYQENGSRLNYNYAFAGTGWTEKIFYPKFNFKPTATYCMFYNNKFAGDLVQRLEECGVSLDLSRVNDGARTFMYATKITRIGSVNVSLAPSINEFFSWCTSLVTIDELTITETTTSGTNMFLNCYELQNIVFNGTVGFNIGLPQSTKLTLESAVSLITHLKDYSADTTNAYKHTVTFSSKTIALLEAEGNASPNGTTWLEYIDSLAWNCS